MLVGDKELDRITNCRTEKLEKKEIGKIASIKSRGSVLGVNWRGLSRVRCLKRGAGPLPNNLDFSKIFYNNFQDI